MEQFRVADHLYILGTTAIAVYVQLIVKWQLRLAGPLPDQTTAKISFALGVLLNPWIISCLAAAALGFLFWVGTMTKFELSYAYPLVVGLVFVLVLLLSLILFRETLTTPKLVGTGLILLGIIVAAR